MRLGGTIAQGGSPLLGAYQWRLLTPDHGRAARFLSEPSVIRLLSSSQISIGCHPVSTLRSLQLPERARSGWLTTPRGKFAMLEAQPTRGVAHRRPALLVHGYTGSKENFLPVLEPLAAAGRIVVAVDLRGQYLSGKPKAA